MTTHDLGPRLRFPRSKAWGAAYEALVPGGAHTYSKGRDQFPEEAPNGLVRGRGALVWDQDGNCLIDWSMGLTSVSLGHAHPEVNKAVCEAIADGVNFQRPAALEKQAAEFFLDFAGGDMVKFARHGSSVTTAAVKLARAFTGRAMVAVPREHPFFSVDDWFIGTTPTDFGVPDDLKRYTRTFGYNDIDSLRALFAAHPDDIACVMMEPCKFDPPRDGFLGKVRELCTRYGALMVLDEMVTGLKFAVPGGAKYFGVEADIATWGKGIANGFSCAALTGRGDVMSMGGISREGQRKLFLLSTTHGAESAGLAAMMRTVDLLRDGTAIADNWSKGGRLVARLGDIAARHGLAGNIRLLGYPCLLALDVVGPDGASDAGLRTLLFQEMIARGVLFQGLFFPTPSHGEAELARTEAAFEAACPVLRAALDSGGVADFLTGPAIKPVFRRYV
jgi:glutamate-1-semialdehyde 2,1-aminomutase